jgi:hypothetical protein
MPDNVIAPDDVLSTSRLTVYFPTWNTSEVSIISNAIFR